MIRLVLVMLAAYFSLHSQILLADETNDSRDRDECPPCQFKVLSTTPKQKTYNMTGTFQCGSDDRIEKYMDCRWAEVLRLHTCTGEVTMVRSSEVCDCRFGR